jgi:hypothetical protein
MGKIMRHNRPRVLQDYAFNLHWSPHRSQFDPNPVVDFAGYIGRVWVHENEVPDDDVDLRAFDIDSVREHYQQLVDSGFRQPVRGATLEEGYLTNQLLLRTRLVCLINDHQPKQPDERIFHWAYLESQFLLTTLRRGLESRTLRSFLQPGLGTRAPIFFQEPNFGIEDWPGGYSVLIRSRTILL